jgi:hypothetical protein
VLRSRAATVAPWSKAMAAGICVGETVKLMSSWAGPKPTLGGLLVGVVRADEIVCVIGN